LLKRKIDFKLPNTKQIPKSLMKEITPQFGFSASNPKNEFSFNITVVLKTKVGRVLTDILNYNVKEVKMSDFQ
jgi:hypothetical protein